MPRAPRAFARIRRRVTCDVDVQGRRHVGVVQDLSPRGFFCQTVASPPIGASVHVILHHEVHGAIRIQARVANQRIVDRRLAPIAKGGIGCAIHSAPESYFQLLSELSGVGAAVR
jgi:hypothetical protein